MIKFAVFVPPEGKQYFQYYYKQITDFFKQNGYVNVSHNPPSPSSPDHSATSPEKPAEQQHKINNYHKYTHWINHAELVILETSVPTIEVGFLLSKALELHKHIIALYLKGHGSEFLNGIHDENLNIVEYKEDTLIRQLEVACQKAKKNTDKRFNFFASPDILNYLNKKTKTMGITKSAFIRNLILDYSKKSDMI